MRLLGALRCPDCRATRLALIPLAQRGDAIDEGAIRCAGCAATFPVIAGVPRMLPSRMLCCLRTLHTEFFRRHPALTPPSCTHPAIDPVARTLVGFSYQHVGMADKVPEEERWKTLFLNAMPRTRERRS
jgi:uncharacterized protein YbaR (Trm112 family)